MTIINSGDNTLINKRPQFGLRLFFVRVYQTCAGSTGTLSRNLTRMPMVKMCDFNVLAISGLLMTRAASFSVMTMAFGVGKASNSWPICSKSAAEKW